MEKLSAEIATKDEEKNTKRCLERVKWGDEIVPPELAHEIRDAIQDVNKLGYYILPPPEAIEAVNLTLQVVH